DLQLTGRLLRRTGGPVEWRSAGARQKDDLLERVVHVESAPRRLVVPRSERPDREILEHPGVTDVVAEEAPGPGALDVGEPAFVRRHGERRRLATGRVQASIQRR